MQKRIFESPAALAGSANPCSINVRDFDRAIRRTTRNVAIFDTVAYTVVAMCGKEERTFRIPYVDGVDLDRLRNLHAKAAGLVDFYGELERRIFPGEPINGMDHPNDHQLQVVGQSFEPILKSRRFDRAYPDGRLTKILQNYRGPAKYTKPVPRLIDADNWSFANFVDPEYTPLALQARIQGKVHLELSVDAATGHITEVRFVSGHRLLEDSAVRAARQWIFSPDRQFPDKIGVTLDYSLVCEATR